MVCRLPTEPETLAPMTQYPGWESNPQAPGFKPGRSAGWRTCVTLSGSRGTRTHERPEAATCFQDRPLIRPDGFRDGFIQSSGGWTRTSGLRVQSAASLPAATAPEFGKEDSNPHRLIQSQGAYRLADSRERPAGVEPACRTWEARA